MHAILGYSSSVAQIIVNFKSVLYINGVTLDYSKYHGSDKIDYLFAGYFIDKGFSLWYSYSNAVRQGEHLQIQALIQRGYISPEEYSGIEPAMIYAIGKDSKGNNIDFSAETFEKTYSGSTFVDLKFRKTTIGKPLYQ